jgi:hypothetical protein
MIACFVKDMMLLSAVHGIHCKRTVSKLKVDTMFLSILGDWLIANQ